MKRLIAGIVCLAFVTALIPLVFAQEAVENGQTVRWADKPAISPDGKTVAFIYMGDLWTVPAEGGRAFRLTDHVANSSWPIFSPDGRSIAFASERFGNYDIYMIDSDGTNLKRVTKDPATDLPTSFSPDGKYLYFTSYRMGSADVFRTAMDGTTPAAVIRTYRESEYFAEISPDGSKIAINVKGGTGGWYRRKYRSSASADVMIADLGMPPVNFEKVATSDFNEYKPVWRPDGKALFYVTSESGTYNLVERELASGEVKALTSFDGPDGVDWFSAAADGETFVIERAGEIWTLKKGYKPTKLLITAPRDLKTNTFEEKNVSGPVDNYLLSPDGKRIAFVMKGDVFLVDSKDGGLSYRITDTPARENQLAWSPDSTRLVYSSLRNGNMDLFEFSLKNRKEKQVAGSELDESSPLFSPDGKIFAYIRNENELVLVDEENKTSRVLLTSNFHRTNLYEGTRFTFSPDSRFLAVSCYEEIGINTIHVVEIETGKDTQVTDFSVSCSLPQWSPDGKTLYFYNHQREEYDIYTLDLVVKEVEFVEEKLDKLFPGKEEPKKEPAEKPEEKESEDKDNPEEKTGEEPEQNKEKPEPDKKKKKEKPRIEIDYKDIERRIENLTEEMTVTDEYSPALTPDGKKWVFFSSFRDDVALYVMDVKPDKPGGKTTPKRLLSSKSRKSDIQILPGGREAFYQAGDNLVKVNLGSGKAQPFRVFAPMKIDDNVMRAAAFDEIRWVLDRYYYDKEHHGVDWNKLAAKYAANLDHIETYSEFNVLVESMIGELNSSHSGYYPPRRETPGVARVEGSFTGLVPDWNKLEETGMFLVAKVFPRSPATRPDNPVKPGEYVLEIDGVALKKGVNVAELLNNKADRRVTLKVGPTEDGKDAREIFIKPEEYRRLYYALYYDWLDECRKITRERSGGRLEYMHISGMNTSSLNKFKREITSRAANAEGVLIDVRFNGGGHTAVNVLSILIRVPWLMRTTRSGVELSENVYRSIALEKPSILLINERSFSNAEIFAEGYRTLEIGRIVGVPTAGGVIGTSSYTLVDGSRIRLPASGAFTINGENLENNGRKPDIHVECSTPEILAGEKPQLTRAIDELLKSLPEKKDK